MNGIFSTTIPSRQISIAPTRAQQTICGCAPTTALPGWKFLFFGRSAHPEDPKPVNFAARQSLEASEAVSRLHRIKPGKMLFVQQNPAAIDAGAFHNDVLVVSNCNVMLYHESAFRDWREMEENITGRASIPFSSSARLKRISPFPRQ